MHGRPAGFADGVLREVDGEIELDPHGTLVHDAAVEAEQGERTEDHQCGGEGE